MVHNFHFPMSENLKMAEFSHSLAFFYQSIVLAIHGHGKQLWYIDFQIRVYVYLCLQMQTWR